MKNKSLLAGLLYACMVLEGAAVRMPAFAAPVEEEIISTSLESDIFAINQGDGSFTVDFIKYDIISEEDRTARVVGTDRDAIYEESWSGSDQGQIELTVPSTVEIKGKTYSVVEIGSFAFADYRYGGDDNDVIDYTPGNGDVSVDHSNLAVGKVTIEEGIRKISEGAFYKTYQIDEVVLPDSVTEIGKSAFYFDFESRVTEAYEFKPLVITNWPKNLTSIGKYAFYNVPFTGAVVLPDKLGTIGDHAFCVENGYGRNCAFDIPESVSSIGRCALQNPGLKAVALRTEDPISFGYDIFGDKVLSGATIYVDDDKINAVESRYKFCINNLTVKDLGAFSSDIQNLGDAGVPATQPKKDGFLLYEVISETDKTVRVANVDRAGVVLASQEYDRYGIVITVPAKVDIYGTTYEVTEIGEFAFAGETFTGVKNITPDLEGDIDYEYVGLDETDIDPPIRKIKLSEGIKKISRGAFFGSINIETVDIPASVEEIADDAFGRSENCVVLRTQGTSVPSGFGTHAFGRQESFAVSTFYVRNELTDSVHEKYGDFKDLSPTIKDIDLYFDIPDVIDKVSPSADDMTASQIRDWNSIYLSMLDDMNEKQLAACAVVPHTDDPEASRQLEEIKALAVKITEGCDTTEEKARAVNKWVAGNIFYDKQTCRFDLLYTPIYPLEVFKNGFAVCQGYAELAELMLKCLGIPALIISGDVPCDGTRYGDFEDYSGESWAGHAWNAYYDDVKNKWVFFDPTWDSGNLLSGGDEWISTPAVDTWFDSGTKMTSPELLHLFAEADIYGRDEEWLSYYFGDKRLLVLYEGQSGSISASGFPGSLTFKYFACEVPDTTDYLSRDYRKYADVSFADGRIDVTAKNAGYFKVTLSQKPGKPGISFFVRILPRQELKFSKESYRTGMDDELFSDFLCMFGDNDVTDIVELESSDERVIKWEYSKGKRILRKVAPGKATVTATMPVSDGGKIKTSCEVEVVSGNLEFTCGEYLCRHVAEPSGGKGAAEIVAFVPAQASPVKGTLTIPDTVTDSEGNVCDVTEIGYRAFCGNAPGRQNKTLCDYFQKVTCLNLPSKLEYIGDEAFGYYARNIKGEERSVSFPATLKSIGKRAFSEFNISNVSFPEGSQLSHIGDYAFNRNIYMAKADLSKCTMLTELGAYVFNGCVSFYSGAEPGESIAEGLREVILPDSVTKIGAYCFNGDKNLKTINFSDRLSEIGEWALCGTSIGPDITFGSSLKKLGERSLYVSNGCLKEVTFTADADGLEIGKEAVMADTVYIPRTSNYVYESRLVDCRIGSMLYSDDKSPAKCAITGLRASLRSENFKPRAGTAIDDELSEELLAQLEVLDGGLVETDVIFEEEMYGSTLKKGENTLIVIHEEENCLEHGNKRWTATIKVTAVDESSDKPSKPDDPDKPDNPDEPDNPDDPDDPSNPDKPDKPGHDDIIVVDDSAYTRTETSKRLEISRTDGTGKVKVEIKIKTPSKGFVYTGKPIEPAVTVTAGGKKLTSGVDYIVSYRDHTDAGTKEMAKAVITGIGEYKGELTETYKISPKNISSSKAVTGIIADGKTCDIMLYDGSVLIPESAYTCGAPAISGSKATVTVTANAGNYTGTKIIKNIKVVDATGKTVLTSDIVKLEKNEFDYTGKAIDVKKQVSVGGGLAAADYSVSVRNNKNVGTGYVIVTGKKKAAGKVILPFTVIPSKTAKYQVKVNNGKALIYKGKRLSPSVKVKASFDGGNKYKSLANKKDFRVTYVADMYPGTGSVVITGIGNYDGIRIDKAENTDCSFKISPQNIAKVAITAKTSSEKFAVTYNKRQLADDDYVLELEELANGKYNICVNGTNDGTKSGSFAVSTKKKVKKNVNKALIPDWAFEKAGIKEY